MATLNTKTRKALPTGKFGLPGPRKYPIPDRAHAGQKAEIDAKANAVLAKK